MHNESKVPKVYLAGPEVFLTDPISIGQEKKDLSKAYGFEGIFPLDAYVDPADLEKREQGLQISRNNENLIQSCDLLIANMTPFRGPNMDVGTAFELGFARALKKPVFGYTNDAGTFTVRTLESLNRVKKRNDGQIEDSFHMEIEDFDLTDNLMIDGAIYNSTGTWVIVARESKKNYYSDLSGFEACLKLAKRFFSGSQCTG